MTERDPFSPRTNGAAARSSGDYPVIGRDLEPIKQSLRDVADEVSSLRHELVPGLRSSWAGRLVGVALIAGIVAGIVGGVVGSVTTRIGVAAAAQESHRAP